MEMSMKLSEQLKDDPTIVRSTMRQIKVLEDELDLYAKALEMVMGLIEPLEEGTDQPEYWLDKAREAMK
jgi:hypothetical protein